MRPERICIEGFGTFREPVEVDFEGAGLFALSGPTGSGKSTVIDAIVFALYGVVPRLDDKKLVGPVISQDRLEAKVRLDFSVGPQHYSATRVVRAKVPRSGSGETVGMRGGTTREARLELRGAGGDPEVLAGTADELTAEVERLLGLSVDHFTTCVVLPQGQFSRFLHNKSADRQKLLKELLDMGVYAEMAAVARSRDKASQAQLAWITSQLEDLDFATAEAAGELAARVAGRESVIKLIDELQPRIESITESIRDLKLQGQDAADCATRLRQAKLPSGVTELAADASASEAAVDDADGALARASAEVDSSTARRDALGDRTALELVRQDHLRRASLKERIEKGRALVAAAAIALEGSEASAEASSVAVELAKAALERARTANRAAELAKHLAVGEPCPVCGNEVHELVDHTAPELTEAEQSVESAREVATAADEVRVSCAANHTRAAGLLAERERELAEIDERLADSPGLESTTETLSAMDTADEAVKSSRSAEKAARVALEAARMAQQQVAGRLEAAWEAFDSTRDHLALLEPPPVDRSDLATAWHPLIQWAQAQAGRYQQVAGSLAQQIAERESERAEVVAQISRACTEAGIDTGHRPARDAAGDALADAKADLKSVEAGLSRRDELEAEAGHLRQTQQVSAMLGRLLGATGFEKWVLDEALVRLVAGATQVLRELSDGAYSLVLDAKSDFFVIDHNNADASRSVRTLSGGETFLASLALALALGDQVAEMAAAGAARLESIFLDEGFGTLDPETLDTVATAIEELGAGGRMVGLVSHVRDLAERMPVRFVVTKGPATSTVERIDL